MLKKITAAFLVLIVSTLVLCTVVSANGVSLYTTYLYTCSSTLTISGTTATCLSKATGYYGETTKITISQTLQKKTSSGDWEYVDSWSETDDGYIGSATNYKYNLSNGTYRLKSVFTVYAGNNSETIEKCSFEKTVKKQ
ncbi:MAG: hypothetical protein OSJ61_01865 [Lachnospiraceae bacterium]|nr:hypothetical protein [Lachnospiraceae bacterium]